MANLKKVGPYYWVEFRQSGRRHRISLKTGHKRTALKMMREIEEKIARGKFNLDDDKVDVRLSIYAEEYLNYSSSVKSSGTVGLERFYLQHLLREVGDLVLREITPQQVDRWKAARLSRVKPVTFNLERRTLQTVFNTALRWGYVDTNAFAGMKKLKEEERRLYMTETELKAFFSAIAAEMKSVGPARRNRIMSFGLYCDFLLNTGLRREEGLRLRPTDIDWAGNQIHVRKTKDKEERSIPLSTRATQILRLIGNDLFSSMHGPFVTHQFMFFAKRAELQGFKLHSLRHTFATRLVELGVDIHTVAKLLGHSDIRTSMIYAKVSEGVKRRAIEKLDQLTNDGHKMATLSKLALG